MIIASFVYLSGHTDSLKRNHCASAPSLNPAIVIDNLLVLVFHYFDFGRFTYAKSTASIMSTAANKTDTVAVAAELSGPEAQRFLVQILVVQWLSLLHL